jgi:hypothetical protein
MANIDKKDREWAEAKSKCRLDVETVKIAREMGLNPRSLIKNIPNKSEPWKTPVAVWIRELYQKRQDKALKKSKKATVTASDRTSS